MFTKTESVSSEDTVYLAISVQLFFFLFNFSKLAVMSNAYTILSKGKYLKSQVGSPIHVIGLTPFVQYVYYSTH